MKFIYITVVLFLISYQSIATDNNSLRNFDLNLDVSQKIIKNAISCGEKNGWKLSVAIVNSEGNLISFQRADGAYLGSVDASLAKANSSNAFQRPTKSFADAVKDGRFGLLSLKNVVAVEGGLPIISNGKHLGAIGVSGAKAIEDEQCAKSALE